MGSVDVAFFLHLIWDDGHRVRDTTDNSHILLNNTSAYGVY